MSEYFDATITAPTRFNGIQGFTAMAARHFGCEPSEFKVEVMDAHALFFSGDYWQPTYFGGYEMRLRAWKEAS